MRGMLAVLLAATLTGGMLQNASIFVQAQEAADTAEADEDRPVELEQGEDEEDSEASEDENDPQNTISGNDFGSEDTDLSMALFLGGGVRCCTRR